MEKKNMEKMMQWEHKALIINRRMKDGDKFYLVALEGRFSHGISLVPDYALETVLSLQSQGGGNAQVISEMVFDGNNLTVVQHLDRVVLEKRE